MANIRKDAASFYSHYELLNIDVVPADDGINGNGSANMIEGTPTPDTITGGGGDDLIFGNGFDEPAAGNGEYLDDRIDGNAGNDVIFGQGGQGPDRRRIGQRYPVRPCGRRRPRG